ncbi:MAG: hypothetical protein GY805_23680, partial [Chloroflexi bacterium]|nr:hypothetical protein [Chloroflexota bacterium]
MNTKAAITSQFLAALEMMKQVVTKCPDDLWHNTAHTNKFWHLAYHGLFYTHLYLQQSEETFTPWPKHRANINYLGQMPYPPHDKIDPG